MPRRSRRPLSLSLCAALAATAFPVIGPAAPAAADDLYRRPTGGVFELQGRGFGHGHGMSQFGAEGMGRSGKSWKQILRFYYPGTDLARSPTRARIRVQLQQIVRHRSSGDDVRFRPAGGLSVRADGHARRLPDQLKQHTVTTWRVKRTSGGLSVTGWAGGKYRKLHGWQELAGPVTVAGDRDIDRSRVVTRYPSGAERGYRGFVRAYAYGSALYVVSQLRFEHYLRSVVAAEVPGGWTRAAYRAQAVAARTYALHQRTGARARGAAWDVCDTTACQVYGGLDWETAEETAAVKDTAGRYLRYAGAPAFTQFSSANGGWSVDGGVPYMRARRDPYDGVVKGSANWGHAWTAEVRAKTLQRKWPALGRLRAIRVLDRDGNGAWNGRIQALRLKGSKGKVTLSGDEFRFALGLKSTWWRVTN